LGLLALGVDICGVFEPFCLLKSRAIQHPTVHILLR
jgi:hypothetical protein